MNILALIEMLMLAKNAREYAEDAIRRSYGESFLESAYDAIAQRNLDVLYLNNVDTRQMNQINDRLRSGISPYIPTDYCIYEMYNNSGNKDIAQFATDTCVSKYEMFVWDIIHKQYKSFERDIDMYNAGVTGILAALKGYFPYKGTGVDFQAYSRKFIIHELAAEDRLVQGVSTKSHFNASNQKKLDDANPDYNYLDKREYERLKQETGFTDGMLKREIQAKLASEHVDISTCSEYLTQTYFEDGSTLVLVDAIFNFIRDFDPTESEGDGEKQKRRKREDRLRNVCHGEELANVMKAKYIDGISFSKMARATGHSRSYFSVPCNRALQKLRLEFGDDQNLSEKKKEVPPPEKLEII